MWASGALSDEDRLDRAETVAVLRRSMELARPYRRTIWAAFGYIVGVTLCAVAGPLLVRVATDHGIGDGNGRVLNIVIAVYVAVVIVNYVLGRQQYLAVNTAGEGFLRDLRLRVFDRLQAQSMAFYDRNKAGVLVSRMTADIESMGELIQWGLLQFVSAGLLVVITLLVMLVISWQLTLGGAARRPGAGGRLDALPTAVERGVPRRARARRPQPRDVAGGHRRGARDPGVPPPAGADRAGSTRATRRCTAATCAR